MDFPFEGAMYDEDPEFLRAIQASLQHEQPQAQALDDAFMDVPLEGEEKKENSTHSSSHGSLHNNMSSCESAKNANFVPSAAAL